MGKNQFKVWSVIMTRKEERRIAEKKAANLNHRKAVNNRVLKKLMSLDLSEEQAKRIIADIISNPIKEITINY